MDIERMKELAANLPKNPMGAMENWAFNELHRPKGIHVNKVVVEKPVEEIKISVESKEETKNSALAALEKYRELQAKKAEVALTDAALDLIKKKANEIIEQK